MRLIILILSLSWLGLSLAKTVPYDSIDGYAYPDGIAIRMFPASRSARNDEEASQSNAIQRYWATLMRNISPFRWNMTSSLGQLFNAGAQQIIETPVASYQDVDRKRKRKSSRRRRRPSQKRSKSRRNSHSRNYNDYYGYASQQSAFNQLQLQPVGLDRHSNMHFYEPNTGRYYALQMISSPDQYNQQQYYDPQYESYNTDEDEGDNDYDESDHANREHEDHEDSEYPDESDESSANENNADHSDNDYESDGDRVAEAAVESGDDYGDDSSSTNDDWGYDEDGSYGERNLKVSFNPKKFLNAADKRALTTSMIKIQKNLLKPETEEDVMMLLTSNKDGNVRKSKPNLKKSSDEEANVKQMKKTKSTSNQKLAQESEMETMRNVLGSYMKDDRANRRRQSAASKPVKRRFVDKPRESARFYVHPFFF